MYRRLGEPLPHQLANTTQVHLVVMQFAPFKQMSCNIYSYAVLAIVSNSYPPLPGRLPTRYSPVRNSSREASSSFSVLLACIRHAASVHPEPRIKLFIWLTSFILRKSFASYKFCLTLFMCLIPVQFSKISASLLPKSAVLIYQVSISMSNVFYYFFQNFFHACIEKSSLFPDCFISCIH